MSVDLEMGDAEARRLILRAMDRGAGDGWTPERLSHLLGLPIATVKRVLDDLVVRHLAVRFEDGEYIPMLASD